MALRRVLGIGSLLLCAGCFSLSANPATVSTAQGASGSSTITVASTLFSGTVALAASGVPSGASASFSPASVAGGGTSVMTLASGSAAAGAYPLTVTGSSGGTSQTASVTWTITPGTQPDFSLSVSPASVTGAGTVTVTATSSGGFASPVALSASGVPSGAGATFSPASIAGGSGTSSLSLSPGTGAAGTYSVTVTGTGGGLTHSAGVTWTLGSTGAIQTVFLIMMENNNWSSFSGSASAPYINGTLLPQASYALNYKNPPSIHPSLPNYLWLEAGTNFGILLDGDPALFHQSTTAHLSTQLQNAGISWRSYEEDITGTACPLTASGLFAPKHDAMLYFDDITNTNNPNSATCIAHVRPYTELATDLQNGTTARYNFITPNLCDDGHNSTGCATTDTVKNSDTWLSTEVPKIMSSAAYLNGGAIFITWDEGEGGDGPIGMIVLSSKAKGHGYTNSLAYTHSSTLRSFEEIFGVSPFLGDAANATDLSDLFTSFP